MYHSPTRICGRLLLKGRRLTTGCEPPVTSAFSSGSYQLPRAQFTSDRRKTSHPFPTTPGTTALFGNIDRHGSVTKSDPVLCLQRRSFHIQANVQQQTQEERVVIEDMSSTHDNNNKSDQNDARKVVGSSRMYKQMIALMIVSVSVASFIAMYLWYSIERYNGRDWSIMFRHWLKTHLPASMTKALHADEASSQHREENKKEQEEATEKSNKASNHGKDDKMMITVPDVKRRPEDRETVIILGTGWGAISVFENLDLTKYNVIIISPRNYSLFTPMLASVTTGHVDNRSIVDSIHNHIERRVKKFKRHDPSVEFYEAKCYDVDWEKQVVLCEQTNTQKHLLYHADQKERTFTVPYDKLVIAVGCKTNTFNTPGVVENCYFLKEIYDAESIRMQLFTNLERANCPGLSEEQLSKMLNFCVVGGGPTGIETAAEINEVLKREVKHYFPNLAKFVRITVIQAADHILNAFDQRMTNYVEQRFDREGIKVITNSRVVRVSPTAVTVRDKSKNEYEIPYGLCLWATGLQMHPLVGVLTSKISEQTHKKSLEVNQYLQVEGINKANVFALGDCSKVNQPQMLMEMKRIFEEADTNKDGYIQIEELERYGMAKASEYPHLAVFVQKSLHDFYKFDLNSDGKLDENEFSNLLQYLDNRLEPLPATAQVANQQGKFLANMLNHGKSSPFHYRHFGSFAYLGRGFAVADIGGHIGSGFQAWLSYKMIYFSKQVSPKNKIAIVTDWTRTAIFGRDTSKV